MRKRIEDLYKDIPASISSSITMDEPNQSIPIYEGYFNLSKDDMLFEIKGKIWFDWFPNSGVRFLGVMQKSVNKIIQLTELNDYFDLIINGLVFGKASLTYRRISKKIEIGGYLNGITVFGDKTIPVSAIRFTIPNLRDFTGLPVKRINDKGGLHVGLERIVFDNDEYLITIDKSEKFQKSFELLKSKGGYIILYHGELKKKRGPIAFDKLGNVIYCFSTFLSFLNGRRSFPHFLQGIHNESVQWTDFTNYNVDQYKAVLSWPQEHSIDELSNLWKEFSKIWNNDNDKDFLVSAIHWYVEANSNSGYLEGSIIMIQTTLELLFNWLVIEKKKVIIGKDGENISASNKIRLLLSQINFSKYLPDSLINLRSFIDSSNDISDEVDAFVQIRNAIVHSQEEKRKKLKEIPQMVKYEVQQLGLWYIELSLLYILNFNGKYHNRCSGKLWAGEGEENIPFPQQK